MKGPGEGQCCCPLLVLLYCTQRSHSLLQMVISTLQGCFEGDRSKLLLTNLAVPGVLLKAVGRMCLPGQLLKP